MQLVAAGVTENPGYRSSIDTNNIIKTDLDTIANSSKEKLLTSDFGMSAAATQEIAANYNTLIEPASTGLMGLYRFNNTNTAINSAELNQVC